MIQRVAPMLLLLACIAGPTRAQMSPPPGTLQAPQRGTANTQANPPHGNAARPPVPPRPASPPAAAPQPAPRVPVQRAAPTVRPPPGPAAQHPPAARPGTRPAQTARPARPATRLAVPPVAVPTVPVPVSTPAPDPTPAEPSKGSSTSLPLPRFASLRSDEVNLRTGPGIRYPIDWVYKRRDLPVQIEREFEVWRLVRDQEGVKGWVHQATLAPRRTAVVVGSERQLRRDAREDATPLARLKPGVIVRLRSCEAASEWCQAQVQDFRGWLRRDEMWGIMPGEAIQ